MKFEIEVTVPDKTINSTVNWVVNDLISDFSNIKFSKEEIKAYKEKVKTFLIKDLEKNMPTFAREECDYILGDILYDDIFSSKEIEALSDRNEPKVKEKELEKTELITIRVSKDIANYYKKLYPV